MPFATALGNSITITPDPGGAGGAVSSSGTSGATSFVNDTTAGTFVSFTGAIGGNRAFVTAGTTTGLGGMPTDSRVTAPTEYWVPGNAMGTGGFGTNNTYYQSISTLLTGIPVGSSQTRGLDSNSLTATTSGVVCRGGVSGATGATNTNTGGGGGGGGGAGLPPTFVREPAEPEGQEPLQPAQQATASLGPMRSPTLARVEGPVALAATRVQGARQARGKRAAMAGQGSLSCVHSSKVSP